jgi:prolyl-tRNA synthetase
MEADTGPIGGDMSHEFIILAETGESGVYFHKDWLKTDLLADIDYNADLQPFVDRFTSIYARADEKHDPANCPVADDDLMTMRGIEIGHIFYFGTKYSAAMGATVSGPDGKNVPVHMGSYGIGVSRLVGGIIEASHDDKGIIWPDSVAPFGVAVVNLKPGDAICDATCQSLYDALAAAGHDPLLDDRDERPGAKLAAMDLIGIPWQIVVGPRGMENGVVEVKRRKSGETSEVSPKSALTMVGTKT